MPSSRTSGQARVTFSVRLAHMVPKGRIYGVDIEPDMVKYLAERAKRDGLKNLIAVRGAPNDPLLPEKADLILIVDTFHHSRIAIATSARCTARSNRADVLRIIDFRMDSPDALLRARVARQMA